MDYHIYCAETYKSIFAEEFRNRLIGRKSKNAIAESERKAQHQAILRTFTSARELYSESVGTVDIWNAIYRAHLFRKVDIAEITDLNEQVVDAIIAGAQSWKKCSGHVFEEYVVEATREQLKHYNITLVLQKELTQMLNQKEISNVETDCIKDIAHSDNFDIYAIVDVNGEKIVFGCIQVKTSIRDRVGRDCEFSAKAMEKKFWSCAVVLDGSYLAMPKFEKMVNGGGTTEYRENGWHGMYVLANATSRGRIYYDKDLALLVEDARQASQRFTSARHVFDRNWKAIH